MRPVVAQWHKVCCKTDWLWIQSPLEEMKYLLIFIFPFLRSCVEEKRGLEFCHSTRNASRIRQKMGNGVSYDTRFLLPTLGHTGYSVKLIWFIYLTIYIDSYWILLSHDKYRKIKIISHKYPIILLNLCYIEN